MAEQKTATFAQIVRASLGHGLVDGVQATAQGGNFRIPLSHLAIIEADDVTPGRERVLDGVEWLAGDSSESPIMSRLNIGRDEPDTREDRKRPDPAGDEPAT